MFNKKENFNISDKEIVYKKISKYLENDFFKEVYSNGTFTIFNVDNLCYYALPHYFIKNKNGEFQLVGFHFNINSLEKYIQNPKLFVKLTMSVINSGEAEFINDNNLPMYKKGVEKLRQNNFKSEINLEYEEYIRQKYMSEDMENTHSMRM